MDRACSRCGRETEIVERYELCGYWQDCGDLCEDCMNDIVECLETKPLYGVAWRINDE